MKSAFDQNVSRIQLLRTRQSSPETKSETDRASEQKNEQDLPQITQPIHVEQAVSPSASPPAGVSIPITDAAASPDAVQKAYSTKKNTEIAKKRVAHIINLKQHANHTIAVPSSDKQTVPADRYEPSSPSPENENLPPQPHAQETIQYSAQDSSVITDEFIVNAADVPPQELESLQSEKQTDHYQRTIQEQTKPIPQEQPMRQRYETAEKVTPYRQSGQLDKNVSDQLTEIPAYIRKQKMSATPATTQPSPNIKNNLLDDAISQIKEEIKATVKDIYPKKKHPLDDLSSTQHSPHSTDATAPDAQPNEEEGHDDDFSQLRKQLEEVLKEIRPSEQRPDEPRQKPVKPGEKALGEDSASEYRTEDNYNSDTEPDMFDPSTEQYQQQFSQVQSGSQAPAGRQQPELATPPAPPVDFNQLKKRLQSAMSMQEQKIEQTPWSIAELTKEIIDALRSKMGAVIAERDALLTTVEHMRKELKNAQARLAEKNSECEKALVLAHERVTLAQQVIEAMEVISSERDQALLYIGQLKKRDEMHSKLLIDAELALNYKNEQIEKMKSSISETQKTVSLKTKEIEQLHVQLAQRTAQRNELHERVTRLEHDLQSASDSRKALNEIRRMVDEAKSL
ncbi:MAG: hypothetical protein JW795_22090 [Chitinivibrionales bacterium]|nr:hypothetical protein [Chitinivibrionales bacterium]